MALLRAFVGQSGNAANLPHYAYDGDDPMPLLRRLTPEERIEFKIDPAIRSLTAPLSEPHVLSGPTPQAQPVLVLRVHVICCADDDGTHAYTNPTTVAQWIGAGLDEANAIYAAHGAGIQFMFDTGDVELVKNTIINRDYTVPAGTNMSTDKDTPPLSDDQIKVLGAPHEAARNALCAKYTDRCVFLLCYGTKLDYDDAQKKWVVGPRTGYAYSWEDKEFVNFPAQWGALRGPEIAHESGHYLHLWHTFGSKPETLADAQKVIKKYVADGNDKATALLAFDGDLGSGVLDTPPDPGTHFYELFSASGKECCPVSLAPTVHVDFNDGSSKTYAFATDRGDVMSYFKDCKTFDQHFSPNQITRMRDALMNQNRRRLVGTQLGDTNWPHLRYSALWNAGTEGCVWWPMCTEDQARAKTKELWGSMRLRQMTGFVVDGNVYYSCIWAPGTYAQVWWPNCSDQQFRAKTDELWKSMRPAQVHAFVVGGEVRYSCLWNGGTQAQVWWENCSEQEFRAKTGELWGSMRPAQMQGFVVNGQVRYSALWNAGTQPVVWWPNCTEQQFRDKTSEVWNTMRPAQVNAFKVGNEMRFSAFWRPSTAAQVWWPLCTEEQLRQKTGDVWSSMRPALWMPAAV